MSKISSLVVTSMVCFLLLPSAYALIVEEFETESHPFTIPGKIIMHDENAILKPTIFWCHDGPHEGTDEPFLKKLAKCLNSNVVGFDFRGSQINGYRNVAQSLTHANKTNFYNCIDADYGGGHMEDLKSVVQHVKQAYGHKINSDRLVIAGHSFGGYMAALAVTDPHYSDTFKLGILCSGFYNLGEYQLQNCPGDDADLEIQRRRSPFLFTQNITCPLFLVHGGESDKTTLVNRADAEKFLQNALKNGKNIQAIFMDEEGHDYQDETWGNIVQRVLNAIQTI